MRKMKFRSAGTLILSCPDYSAVLTCLQLATTVHTYRRSLILTLALAFGVFLFLFVCERVYADVRGAVYTNPSAHLYIPRSQHKCAVLFLLVRLTSAICYRQVERILRRIESLGDCFPFLACFAFLDTRPKHDDKYQSCARQFH